MSNGVAGSSIGAGSVTGHPTYLDNAVKNRNWNTKTFYRICPKMDIGCFGFDSPLRRYNSRKRSSCLPKRVRKKQR